MLTLRDGHMGSIYFFCIFKIEIYTIMSFCLKGLKLGITAQPSFLIPALRRWRVEDQEFKMLDYIV